MVFFFLGRLNPESRTSVYPLFEINSSVLDELEPVTSPREGLDDREMRILPSPILLKIAEGTCSPASHLEET